MSQPRDQWSSQTVTSLGEKTWCHRSGSTTVEKKEYSVNISLYLSLDYIHCLVLGCLKWNGLMPPGKSVSYPDPVFVWAGVGSSPDFRSFWLHNKGSGVQTRWDLGMRLYTRSRSGIVLSVHMIMSTTAQLGVCIHSVCLTCISMTFEPTGDTCVLLLVGVACTFGMISYVQQSVRKMAERTMKEFQEVSKVSTTSLSMRIWPFLETAILCFASHCSLIFIDHIAEFMR